MSSAPTGTSPDHSSTPSSDRSADRSVDEAPASSTRFADLGLGPELLAALNDLGYEEPTPVQAEAVPYLLAGRDLLGQAATGTGKTAAFALPLLQRLADASRSGEPAGKGPSALVLAPTRELALQVASATESYGTGLGVRVLAVYGGAPIGGQLRELQRGVDVVVGTPGRVLDHLSRGSLDLSGVKTVVLDEADEMLDAGFQEDIEGILERAPRDRQTVLFSATMAGRIERIARTHQTDPVRVVLQREVPEGGAPLVEQRAHVVQRAWKLPALRRVLDVEAPAAAIIFCRSRGEVDELTESLNGRGMRAEALHGGMSQDQRDRVMGRLRAGVAQLLVATDVAARGLDVEQLTHVINYDVPASSEAYVHRIGRVGRGGRSGVAITIAEPREARYIGGLERASRGSIAVVPVPTAETLRERRAERTAAALEAADVDGAARELAAKLTAERDPSEVLAAALVLLAQARGEKADEPDVPDASSGRPLRSGPRAGAERSARPIGGARGEGRRAPHGRPAGPAGAGRKPRIGGEVSRVWVGLGRQAGVRPQDLVGAVTGETRLDGGEVGAIEVHERYSIVEVPSGAVDDVVTGLQSGLIRGRKVRVRPERF
ncbi:DEAD/DEAH box helicase [Quadrisphaera setariae]|uniref:RNA helicase n=1 Tax=Quadrisphaera setariae TaxID=2593304 RepID=A0A5C8ZLC7_9ACTN|nr:DEAD/DEAH box helicase [Quadrisphaera setariae]TXR57600.1 DEAD/DEAH box helicase [Quadrisphaera setariae]